MEAIVDSSSIILLAKINKLELLTNLFSTLKIPQAVIKEVVNTTNDTEKKTITRFIDKHMKIINTEPLRINLGAGESAALSYLQKNPAAMFVTDDQRAARMAKLFAVEVIGVLGILLINTKEKNITKQQVKQNLELLLDEGFYLSTTIYREFLEQL